MILKKEMFSNNNSIVVPSLRISERKIIFSICFVEQDAQLQDKYNFYSFLFTDIWLKSEDRGTEDCMEHGTPANLCGIPRCLYQAPEDRNLWQSFTRLSTTPASITTESSGRDTWMRSLSSDHNYQVSPGACSAPASRCLCRCRWWSARSAGRSHPKRAVTSQVCQQTIYTSCNF